jgi:LacI family transcriptional regulator
MADLTLEDVAKKSGVSKMTVSAVLRNTGRISDDTRRRVLSVADELGYRVNAAARATRTGRFGNIALLMSTNEHQSYLSPIMLEAIHDALAEQNLHLSIAKLPDTQLDSDDAVPLMLQQYSADGLLIDYTWDIPAKLMDRIARSNVPAVYMNTPVAADAVYVDECHGGRELAQHLIELGHQRIAYVDTWWGRDHEHAHHSVGDRRTGYADALAQAGIEPEWFLLERAKPDEQRAHLTEWLAREDRPSAIVTYWTSDAWPILQVCATLGIQPGLDLSLASFCQPNDHAAFGFGLTTLSQPEAQLGRRAVDMLNERMNGAAPLPPAVVRGRLVQGITSGPSATVADGATTGRSQTS